MMSRVSSGAGPHRQRGLSLVSIILLFALVGFIGVGVVKVTPAVLEYFTILKDANAVVGSKDSTTVMDVRNAFMKRIQVDDITAVSASDLDISKDGNDVVISFAYSRKIPLFGPVSLVIDFAGTTNRGGK